MRRDVTKFGANPGSANNAQYIQAAINDLKGTGGTVVIPAGTYYTGTLELFSQITLYLDAGAVLKGTADMQDYPAVGLEQNEFGPVHTLLFAHDAENVGLAGDGIIDFNGDRFFDFEQPFNPGIDMAALSQEQRMEVDVKPKERPNQLIYFKRCRGVNVQNITLTNAPCWTLVLSSCDDVQVTGIRIRNNQRIPNNDGIHLCSCQNVRITNNDIVTGDDCIAITGIDDWQRETRHVVVANCLLSSASTALRIGYWRSKVHDVQVSQCTIYDSNRGINIMATGSGTVTDVRISGIHFTAKTRAGGWWGRGEAIYFNTAAFNATNHPGVQWDKQDIPVNIDRISIDHIQARAVTGVALLGHAGTIGQVSISDLALTMVNDPNRGLFGDELDAKPSRKLICVPADGAYWLVAHGLRRLSLKTVNVRNQLKGPVNRVDQSIDHVEFIRVDQLVAERSSLG